LAKSALDVVDEVLFVLPRAFPHKTYEQATLDQRLTMLRRCLASDERYSLAVTDGGLFLEIATECRGHYPAAQLSLLCGRDAAERMLTWKYDEEDALQRIFAEFHLLVAPRSGRFEVPAQFRHAIQELSLCDYDSHSSTTVRDRARAGGWEGLVPEEIADMVRQIYGGDANG
jgi:nicotinic acid mononucleotide adenylyltransferase